MKTDAIEQIDISDGSLVSITSRMRVREDVRDIPVGAYGTCMDVEYVLSAEGRTFSRIKRESHWIDDATFARVEFRNVPDEWEFLTGDK